MSEGSCFFSFSQSHPKGCQLSPQKLKKFKKFKKLRKLKVVVGVFLRQTDVFLNFASIFNGLGDPKIKVFLMFSIKSKICRVRRPEENSRKPKENLDFLPPNPMEIKAKVKTSMFSLSRTTNKTFNLLNFLNFFNFLTFGRTLWGRSPGQPARKLVRTPTSFSVILV